MINILDLFSGTQSVRKALTKKYKITSWKTWSEMGYQYENGYKIPELVYGFTDGNENAIVSYIGLDIYSPEEPNTIFDLLQDDVINKLKTLLGEWIPDFIWSSPVCNKFSTACAYEGGNLFFEKSENNSIKIREIWNDKKSKSYPYQKCQDNKLRYQSEAELALKMHLNGKLIIDSFNVPFAIENPRRAMSKYLYTEYVNNFTSYCMYGFEYEKPTTIYSNKILNLKICNHRPKRDFHTIMLSGSAKDYTNGRKNMSSYAKRSSVPQQLIIEVFEQSMKGTKNE